MVMSSSSSFLLVFDHSKNEQLVCEDFGSDVESATKAYSAMEARYRKSSVVDVVLVGSDSIETVQATHSNYFVNGSRDLVARALESLTA